jgi:hypothetical protein
MNNSSIRRGVCLAPCAALAVALLASCTSDSSVSSVSSPPLRGVDRVRVALTVEQQQRLASAKDRAKWVGESHHAAMHFAIADVQQRRREKRSIPREGSAGYCRLMYGVGERALAVIDPHLGVRRSDQERQALIRQDAAFSKCSRDLMVFRAPNTSVRGYHLAQEAEPEVFGVYEEYIAPLESTVSYSNGNAQTISDGVDHVLATAVANGIPEGDLLVLASFASLINSSAAEWNAFDWPKYGGSRDTAAVPEMAVFPLPAWDDRPLAIIGADVGGCLTTVKGLSALRLLLAGPAWKALAGICGFRGAFASTSALLAMI